MSEYEGKREVEHRVFAELSEEDQYDSEETDPWRIRKGIQRKFRVRHINWSSDWRSSEMTEDATVSISGLGYRKDGSLGVVIVKQRVPLASLPEQIQAGIRKAYEEVYRP